MFIFRFIKPFVLLESGNWKGKDRKTKSTANLYFPLPKKVNYINFN